MEDPWGPGVKRKVASVDSYIKAWEALGVEKFRVSYIRERRGPIFMQEQLQYLIQAMDGDGNLHFMVDTGGKVLTTEDSAVSIANSLTKALKAPHVYKADGVSISTSVSVVPKPIPSVVGGGCVITADGAGNIGAAADVLAAVASKQLDLVAVLQVDTTGSYTTKWCEDPTGTPAPGTPDYHTAGHIMELVAGFPYIIHLMTDTDNKGFGYDAGVNGNWPNGAVMTITGSYAEV